MVAKAAVGERRCGQGCGFLQPHTDLTLTFRVSESSGLWLGLVLLHSKIEGQSCRERPVRLWTATSLPIHPHVPAGEGMKWRYAGRTMGLGRGGS